jgi:peptide deformylase
MDPSHGLLTLGHPLLRSRSQPVVDPRDPQLQRLIDQLLTTLTTANGVGIAAPQLGYAQRLLIVASRPNLRYPHAPTMAPTVVINPRLVAHSDEVEPGWEGCLSVPGVRGNVRRFRQVEVEYLNRQGQPQRQVWQGFIARILQHEYDHLEGKVFLDRVEQPTDLLSEVDYQAMEIETLG